MQTVNSRNSRPSTVGLSIMDVSSQSLDSFADDVNVRRDSDVIGTDDVILGEFFVNVGGEKEEQQQQQLAAEEERQLVGLTTTVSSCQDLNNIFDDNSFSGKPQRLNGKQYDVVDKETDVLAEQFDKYLEQFNQINHLTKPFSMEEDLDDNFETMLFPDIDF